MTQAENPLRKTEVSLIHTDGKNRQVDWTKIQAALLEMANLGLLMGPTCSAVAPRCVENENCLLTFCPSWTSNSPCWTR